MLGVYLVHLNRSAKNYTSRKLALAKTVDFSLFCAISNQKTLFLSLEKVLSYNLYLSH